MRQYRVATRKSKLAVRQTEIVIEAILAKNPQLEAKQFKIVHFDTIGDQILDRKLDKIGGKGLFTKELEDGLRVGEVDFAVHSLKDMPANISDEFTIDYVLARENPCDIFISSKYSSLKQVPKGGVIGTSSARRKSQLLNLRPDLRIVNIRGNIQTRLTKIDSENLDGTILAAAGLIRLGLDLKYEELTVEQMLPAVGQGAICMEVLKTNEEVKALLETVNDTNSLITTKAERSFLKEFGGDCSTPIAAYAHINNNRLILKGLISTINGDIVHEESDEGELIEAEKLGTLVAMRLKQRIEEGFFE